MSKLVEEWRDIKGYEGLYQVSDWGNVRSLDRVVEFYNVSKGGMSKRFLKGQLLKKVLNTQGYHVVCLHNSEHQQKEGKVHILVAKAFIPNPENKTEVGHLKTMENGLEDKTANEVWHLAWMTREENGNYGTIIERLSESKKGDKNPNFGNHLSEETRKKMSESRKGRKTWNKGIHTNFKKSKKVNQYNLITGEFIKTWDSAADVEAELGICKGNIRRCCNQKVKSAGGYKWDYYE